VRDLLDWEGLAWGILPSVGLLNCVFLGALCVSPPSRCG
jgi:hypothetical protein